MYVYFLIGLILSLSDIFLKVKTLKINILKRIIIIITGVLSIYFVDSSYFFISYNGILLSLIFGLILLITHIIIAKGVKLKKDDVTKGLVYTSVLIYFLELPAEELLYRGVILIPLIHIFNPTVAIIFSSVIFLILHLKTWNNKFVWFGSLFIGLICSITTIYTNSIWSAIIIHNLNDFGFLTLINKRNIFKSK